MGPVLHNSAREEVGSENVYPRHQMAMFIWEMTKHEVDGYPIFRQTLVLNSNNSWNWRRDSAPS